MVLSENTFNDEIEILDLVRERLKEYNFEASSEFIGILITQIKYERTEAINKGISYKCYPNAHKNHCIKPRSASLEDILFGSERAPQKPILRVVND